MMISIVRGVREIRHNLNLSPKEELEVKLNFMHDCKTAWMNIASRLSVSNFSIREEQVAPKGHAPFKFDGGMGYVQIPAGFNLSELKDNTAKKIEKFKESLAGVDARLSNESFVASAPKEIVEENRTKKAEYAEAIERLKEFYELI